MPKRTNNTPETDALLRLAKAGTDTALLSALREEFAAGRMSETRASAIIRNLRASAAARFVSSLDETSSVVMELVRGEDGDLTTLIAQTFSITITGPTKTISSVMSDRAPEFANLVRVAGFVPETADVMLITRAYALSRLHQLATGPLYAVGKEMIRLAGAPDEGAGHVLDLLPEGDDLVEEGIVTRTFVGHVLIAERAANERVSPETANLTETIDAYEAAARSVFGSGCVVGIPTVWPLSVESALAMRLDQAYDLTSEMMGVRGVSTAHLGEMTTFLLLSDEEPDFGACLNVPRSVTLRCPEDLDAWATETLALGLDDDAYEEPEEDDMEGFLSQLAQRDVAAPPKSDDTTNLVFFTPKGR